MALHYDAPNGSYTQAIPPGMRAFRTEVATHFGFQRTEVIRDQSRCQQSRSEHCECRACDFFTTNITFGRRVFEWCVTHADALGIQSVIFNRRVWGFGNWTERAYTGPSPHTDHVHVGLNVHACRTLTREKVRAHLSPGPQPQPVPKESYVYIRRKGAPSGAVYRVGPVLEHVSAEEWNALPDPKPVIVEVEADSVLYRRPKLLDLAFDPS